MKYRKTLKSVASYQEGLDTITALEQAFLKTFKRKPDCQIVLHSFGRGKDEKLSVAIAGDTEIPLEVSFFVEQSKKTNK